MFAVIATTDNHIVDTFTAYWEAYNLRRDRGFPTHTIIFLGDEDLAELHANATPSLIERGNDSGLVGMIAPRH